MRNGNSRFPEGGCTCKLGGCTCKPGGCTGSGSLNIKGQVTLSSLTIDSTVSCLNRVSITKARYISQKNF